MITSAELLFGAKVWLAGYVASKALQKWLDHRNAIWRMWRPLMLTPTSFRRAYLVAIGIELLFALALVFSAKSTRFPLAIAAVALFVGLTIYGVKSIRTVGECGCGGSMKLKKKERPIGSLIFGIRNATICAVGVTAIVAGPTFADLLASSSHLGVTTFLLSIIPVMHFLTRRLWYRSAHTLVKRAKTSLPALGQLRALVTN